MKRQIKYVLWLSVCLLFSPAVLGQLEPVRLTGLACLLNEKMALLTVTPDGTEPMQMTLSEGQGQQGIKLLKVDMDHHQVEIEQNGVHQIINLCQPAKLVAENPTDTQMPGGTAGLGSTPSATRAAYLSRNDKAERINAGAPTGATAGTGAKSGSDGDAGAASGAGSNSSASSDTKSDHSNEVWYQESQNIEELRKQTADDVLAGKTTALPRTPLTEPDTDKRLVGVETMFGNHIPHFVCPGTTASLAAQ
jgi:predicted RNA-binding protein